MENINESRVEEVPVPVPAVVVPAMNPLLRRPSKFFISTSLRENHVDPLHHNTDLPPTLHGFFYGSGGEEESHHHHLLPCKNYGRFATVPGMITSPPSPFPANNSISIDPSLTFLRKSLRPLNSHLYLLDSTNGLLLLGHMPAETPIIWPDFVVCNPTTQQLIRVPTCVDWVDFDDERHDPTRFASQTHISLLFDPAVSSHFQVLIFWHWGRRLLKGTDTTVHAYSSETGEWRNSESHWSLEERRAAWQLWRHRRQSQTSTVAHRWAPGAFVDGMLYLNLAWCKKILQVDVEGKTRGLFPAPPPAEAAAAAGGNKVLFLGRSQGRLHCVVEKGRPSHEVSVWVLLLVGDDDDVEEKREWVLKHKVSSGEMFGDNRGNNCEGLVDYRVVALHPDCDVVFFHMQRWEGRPMISYDFSRQEVRAVETYKHCPGDKITPFVPYLSELLVGVLGGHK